MEFRIDFNNFYEKADEILSKLGDRDEESGNFYINIHTMEGLRGLQDKLHELTGESYTMLIIDFEPGDNTIFFE